MDNVLDFCAEEALATLFQPDTVAAAEYFKSYERTPGLEAEKKLMLAVLESAVEDFQKYVLARKARAKAFVSRSGGVAFR